MKAKAIPRDAAEQLPVAAGTSPEIRLRGVLARIDAAEKHYGRASGSVALLAVNKTKPAADIATLAAAGQRAFGENYLQEALTKMDSLKRSLTGTALEWHFIGPLQSNKTRAIAERFDWVHSVDRVRIARRLSEQRPAQLPPLNVCLQVNIDGETSKSGIAAEAVAETAAAVAALPRISLRGLMALPAPAAGLAGQRLPFARVREIQRQLIENGLDLDTLSMGMSGDLEAAIAEGATWVRVGTALFGARNKSANPVQNDTPV